MADEWDVASERPIGEWDVKSVAATQSPSSAQSALAGYLDTASFGFHDEIRGASKASGLPEWMGGFRAPVGAARLGYEYLTGGNDATKTYEAARDETRAMRKAAEEENPGEFFAGQVGGSLVTPGMAAAKGAGLGARSLNAAKAGAMQGGLYGAGSGESMEDRASRAATGTVLGGVIGGASPAIVQGVASAGKWAAKPITTAYQGIRDPDKVALKNIAGGLRESAEIDPAARNRLTPAEFQSNIQQGGPATVMDLGGEPMRAIARSAANTSPSGRSVLNDAINERFEGQSGRVSDWLRHTFNYPDAHATRQALDQARAATLNPLYKKAYKESNGLELWDDGLDQLVQAPEVRNAIRIAQSRLANWTIAEGGKRPAGAFILKPSGETLLRETAKGNEYRPSLQLWDYVKQSLDQMGAGPNGSPTARQFAHEIRVKMDNFLASGSYQDARSAAAGFFGASNALEAGQKFVTERLNNEGARAALAKMNPTERKLFQDGFVSRFVDTINEKGNRQDVLRFIAESPAAKERLNMVLGPQRAKEFEASLRVEGIMDFARKAVQGNSTTARQLVELGLAGGTYGAGELFGDPKSLMYAGLVWGAAHGKGVVNERIAKRTAEMLVSRDPDVARRAIAMIARNPNLSNSLRKFDEGIRRVAAPQSSGVPLLSSAGVGHSEEDQPEAPRPIGQYKRGGHVGDHESKDSGAGRPAEGDDTSGGAVKAHPTIDRRYDVPYLAGASNDGKTVYIDRRVPRKIAVKRANGKGFASIDPAGPLAVHEQTEHAAMLKGKSYDEAHVEDGTAAERAWVKAHGLDWLHYEKVMNGFISHVKNAKPRRAPPDLYLKPYPAQQQRTLKRLAAA